MRRSVLVTVVVLGGLVCAIGGTGLFAALTDSATSGTNSVESGALAASADIQLARATNDGAKPTCGTFTENLSSPIFTVSDVSPGFQSDVEYYCVKNVGSQPVTLSVKADPLVDLDLACTGDEALHGDTTCGNNQDGELAAVLRVSYGQLTDCSSNNGSGSGAFLRDNGLFAHALGTLAVGETRCFSTDVWYPANTADPARQKAQSDQVRWQYLWLAQS